MNRRQVQGLVATVALGAAWLVVPSTASAVSGADGAGRHFGQHVAHHAQEGMLSGEMNPGHHRGFAGFGHHDH